MRSMGTRAQSAHRHTNKHNPLIWTLHDLLHLHPASLTQFPLPPPPNTTFRLRTLTSSNPYIFDFGTPAECHRTSRPCRPCCSTDPHPTAAARSAGAPTALHGAGMQGRAIEQAGARRGRTRRARLDVIASFSESLG